MKICKTDEASTFVLKLNRRDFDSVGVAKVSSLIGYLGKFGKELLLKKLKCTRDFRLLLNSVNYDIPPFRKNRIEWHLRVKIIRFHNSYWTVVIEPSHIDVGWIGKVKLIYWHPPKVG